MGSRTFACALAALVVGPSACHRIDGEPPAPLVLREFVVPDDAVTEDSVLALNGPPQRRERVDGLEMWVCSRSMPEGVGLRSTTAIVWFRNGAVLRTEVREGFTVPTPTFPVEPGGSAGPHAASSARSFRARSGIGAAVHRRD